MIWWMCPWSGDWVYQPVYGQGGGLQCWMGVMVWQVGMVLVGGQMIRCMINLIGI